MNAITVQNLDYEVPEKRILRDINLEVASGEILAIMGMSGCGKTSLLKCLSGLARPTRGELRVGDDDLVTLPENELDRVRLRMGLVFQYAALFDSLTVFENVSFGLKHHRKMSRAKMAEIVAQRLREVGMEGSEPLYPRQLSGGMQKRVGLARALATEPEILFYDEPTSGLDPVIARNIDDLIVHTRERLNVTSVVVSHDIPSVFRIADRVAMMQEGAIVAVGTPDEMRASAHPVVREFLEAGLAGEIPRVGQPD